MNASKLFKMSGGGAAAAAVAGLMSFGQVSTAHAEQRLGGVIGCDAPGGKQEAGALIGALVGAAAGSNLAKNDRGTGTAIGAVVGAGAGSAIGCKMQRDRAGQQYGTYTRGGYRLSSNVAAAPFQRDGGAFVARSSLNLRSAPSTGSARVGQLRAGESFQALARVRGTDWILVGDNGVGVGYVHGGYVSPASDYRYASY